MPHELLQQLVRVLLSDHLPRSFNDVLSILRELLALRRELVCAHEGMVEHVLQRVVDLLVSGHTPEPEGFNGTV
jgi:hypothetical protein